MSAILATRPSRALLAQLASMLDQVQTPECRHWLEQELNGYSLSAPLPWYRMIACRQRGHFLALKTGKHLICHIGSHALNQRDLARIQFIYAREPAAHYLLQRHSGIEPWPEQLLEEYQQQLIPGHICLQAWHEPLISPCDQLLEGITHFISEYPKQAALQSQHGFKALQHQHWHI